MGKRYALVRWSHEAENMFGWKAEEVLGKHIGDFPWVYVDDAQHVQQVSQDLQHGIQRFSANRNYRKGGTVINCHWYNSSLLDEQGKIRSILSLVQDVTEQLQTQEALRQSEQRYRMLFDRNPDGVFAIDAAGRFLLANHAAEAICGYTVEELLKTNFSDLCAPDQLPQTLERFQRN